MIGIMLEALIIEFFIRFFGNNLVSLSIAGALSVSSALIHKVMSLLILYGFNIVKIYVSIFNFFTKQARIENANPWFLVFVVITIYVILGIGSTVIGMMVGKRSAGIINHNQGFKTEEKNKTDILSTNPNQLFNLVLFFIHLILIPVGLIILNIFSLLYSTVFVLIYSAFCIYRYKSSLRRLKKPVFWIQLIILTFLAAIFWNGFRSEDSFFGIEGLLIGFEMNIRALFVVIAFSSFGVELRNPVIRDYLFKKGFDTIYSAMGLSFSALPVMIEAMPKPKTFLRHPVRSFSNMMIHAREWLGVFEKSQFSTKI